MARPALNRDTTVCISLSGRPSNHGIKFHNYLYEKHGLDYLYKAMTTTVDTGDTHFVVADLVSRNKVKKLIENTLNSGGEA